MEALAAVVGELVLAEPDAAKASTPQARFLAERPVLERPP
jgi:hypothetical protein